MAVLSVRILLKKTSSDKTVQQNHYLRIFEIRMTKSEKFIHPFFDSPNFNLSFRKEFRSGFNIVFHTTEKHYLSNYKNEKRSDESNAGTRNDGRHRVSWRNQCLDNCDIGTRHYLTH